MNMERIKLLRENLELTQEKFAQKLGCTRSAYSLWELNKNVIPLKVLNDISNKFNVDIDYLVGISDKKKKNLKQVQIDRAKIGKKIKLARKEKKLTQEVLAKKLNTTHSVISAYENGKTLVPTIFIIEIAKITKKSLNWFLDK